jgi:hypothetical protein
MCHNISYDSMAISWVDVKFFLEDVIIHYRGHPLIHPPFQMLVMGQFPGPNSILFLDNVLVHQGGCIAEICNNANVFLLYLPPYSPDMT